MDERFLPWRYIFGGSRRRGIPLLIIIFALAILLYTVIFRAIYPVFEGKDISWPAALLFVLESITSVGCGDLRPFRSDVTMLFTVILILAGVFMIFMFIPVL